MMDGTSRVLAIDPGRLKCGLAICDRQQGVLQQAVVEQDQLMKQAAEWLSRFDCRVIVLGNKTASQQVAARLAEFLKEKRVDQIVFVDEHNSTLEARQRYWQSHPPTGWRALVPQGLLTPPCAIDDFAAIILAERYFQECIKNSKNKS